MDEETAKKAIDFYMKKVTEKSTAIITFFGGESLLAFDLIKKVCEYIELNYINTNKDFPFTSLILRIRKLFTYKHNNDYMCGLGKTMFAVDAFGDIEDAKLGSVEEVSIKDFKLEHKKKCDNCWNNNSCTHGCSYEDYKNEKEMDYFCMYSKKKKKMTEMSISICGKLKPEKLKKIVSV